MADDEFTRLRREMQRIVHDATGLNQMFAIPVADAICRQLQEEKGGERLYIPAPTKGDRMRMIRDASALGLTVDQISTQYKVHRSTVYRALNGRG